MPAEPIQHGDYLISSRATNRLWYARLQIQFAGVVAYMTLRKWSATRSGSLTQGEELIFQNIMLTTPVFARQNYIKKVDAAITANFGALSASLTVPVVFRGTHNDCGSSGYQRPDRQLGRDQSSTSRSMTGLMSMIGVPSMASSGSTLTQCSVMLRIFVR